MERALCGPPANVKPLFVCRVCVCVIVCVCVFYRGCQDVCHFSRSMALQGQTGDKEKSRGWAYARVQGEVLFLYIILKKKNVHQRYLERRLFSLFF